MTLKDGNQQLQVVKFKFVEFQTLGKSRYSIHSVLLLALAPDFDIICHDIEAAGSGFDGTPGGMGGQQDIIPVQDLLVGVILAERLHAEHVHTQTTDPILCNGLGQCFLVRHQTTGHIDENSILLHQGDLFCTDHATGPLIQRSVD